MVEEIITALSPIHWLFVIARASRFTYKGQAIDVRRVGRGVRRFGAKPRKNFVDDQAASPSSWKTPRMAVWMAA
jgi:hypothetical protein